uniref:Uncharacterized protein n=1 Tax=Arundo donax TaxID=35708 RepID=A0A0A8XUM6_ARUDO
MASLLLLLLLSLIIFVISMFSRQWKISWSMSQTSGLLMSLLILLKMVKYCKLMKNIL